MIGDAWDDLATGDELDTTNELLRQLIRQQGGQGGATVNVGTTGDEAHIVQAGTEANPIGIPPGRTTFDLATGRVTNPAHSGNVAEFESIRDLSSRFKDNTDVMRWLGVRSSTPDQIEITVGSDREPIGYGNGPIQHSGFDELTIETQPSRYGDSLSSISLIASTAPIPGFEPSPLDETRVLDDIQIPPAADSYMAPPVTILELADESTPDGLHEHSEHFFSVSHTDKLTVFAANDGDDYDLAVMTTGTGPLPTEMVHEEIGTISSGPAESHTVDVSGLKRVGLGLKLTDTGTGDPVIEVFNGQ